MKNQRPTEKHIWRASIDTKVIGHFTGMHAAMKALSARAIKAEGGYNGYVDVYDPNDTIMPMKGPDSDNYKCMRHRVVDGGRGNNGWFWND